MRYRLTKHAVEKIELLGVSVEQVQQTIDEPEERVFSESAKYFYQRLFERNGGQKFLLRVLVDEAQIPASVVTVYVSTRYNRYRRLMR